MKKFLHDGGSRSLEIKELIQPDKVRGLLLVAMYGLPHVERCGGHF